MKKSWNQVSELLVPSMYWVSEMKASIQYALVGKNRAAKEDSAYATYATAVEKAFGKETLEILSGVKAATMLEYSECCYGVYKTVESWVETNDARCITELEDMMFYTGEIFNTIQKVRELCVLLGFGDNVEDKLNELGVNYVSMSV